MNLIRKIYAFNQYYRDIWMQTQAGKIPNGSKVLDIGAGSAPYRKLFEHCNYITQDFAQLKDDQLRGLKGYNKLDIISDITNIPVESESFDVIICTEVIEHVPEPIKAIAEFSRILKKDGKLLLTAPLGSGIHQEPFHFYGGYTPFWYRKFLSEYGFKCIEIESNRGFYSLLSQELIRLIMRAAPWRSFSNFLFFPFWVMALPISLMLPLVSAYFDKKDRFKDFTIGYHIIAIKSS